MIFILSNSEFDTFWMYDVAISQMGFQHAYLALIFGPYFLECEY